MSLDKLLSLPFAGRARGTAAVLSLRVTGSLGSPRATGSGAHDAKPPDTEQTVLHSPAGSQNSPAAGPTEPDFELAFQELHLGSMQKEGRVSEPLPNLALG